MNYKVLKEAAVRELMNEDWEGRSQEEREKENSGWGESARAVLKPIRLKKTEMRNLPKHVTDRRQYLADLDSEDREEQVPVAAKADGKNEWSAVQDDWDSYNDNAEVVRARSLNDTPMSKYVELKHWLDRHDDKQSALLDDPVGLSRLFDLVNDGSIGREYATKLIKYATKKYHGYYMNLAPGRTKRRTKIIGDW